MAAPTEFARRKYANDGVCHLLLSEMVEGSVARGEHTGCRVGSLQRPQRPSTRRFICAEASSRVRW